MKIYLLALSILACFILMGCEAGYVAKRPADVVYVRPASPGAGYVWTTGEWEYMGGAYHWREGSWKHTREGHIWKPGYWESGHKGYKWHKGHWQ